MKIGAVEIRNEHQVCPNCMYCVKCGTALFCDKFNTPDTTTKYAKCELLTEKIMENNAINRAVEHPVHYNQYDVEVLEMMRRIWGEEATETFCKLNAFKYRMRAGHKDDVEQDLEKEKFYLNYIRKMEASEDVRELAREMKK